MISQLVKRTYQARPPKNPTQEEVRAALSADALNVHFGAASGGRSSPDSTESGNRTNAPSSQSLPSRWGWSSTINERVKVKVELKLNVFFGQRKFRLLSTAWVEEQEEDHGPEEQESESESKDESDGGDINSESTIIAQALMAVVGDWAYNAESMQIELLMRHAEELSANALGDSGDIGNLLQHLPLHAADVVFMSGDAAASNSSTSRNGNGIVNSAGDPNGGLQLSPPIQKTLTLSFAGMETNLVLGTAQGDILLPLWPAEDPGTGGATEAPFNEAEWLATGPHLELLASQQQQDSSGSISMEVCAD